MTLWLNSAGNHVPAHHVTQVQRSIGRSDYVRRDMALKNMIQPLAGEYGMHNNQPQREWKLSGGDQRVLD